MPKRFCFTGNSLNELCMSTPSPNHSTDGYYVAASALDHSELSIGLRFNITSNAETVSTLIFWRNFYDYKEVYFHLYTYGGKVILSTKLDGSIELFSGLHLNEWYSLWIDIYESDLEYHLYRYSTNTTTSDSTGKTYYEAVDSYIFVMNTSTADAPLLGTMCDLIIIPGRYSELRNVYMQEGLCYVLTNFWPMREGSGTTCRCLRTPSIGLQSGGSVTAPGWVNTFGTNEGRRWV